MLQYGVIDDSDIQQNYVTFLCLSDIFDLQFNSREHFGINNFDAYTLPVFRWGIPNKPTHESSVSKRYKGSFFQRKPELEWSSN